MSNADRRTTSASGIRDIGTFVENYERLLDKLYPVLSVWDGVVYIVRYAFSLPLSAHRPLAINTPARCRWENYLLTLCVLMALSFLLYWPGKLCSFHALGSCSDSNAALLGLPRDPSPSSSLLPSRSSQRVDTGRHPDDGCRPLPRADQGSRCP